MATTNLDTLALNVGLVASDLTTTLINAVTKAATFAGGVVANVTGNLTGNVTGNSVGYVQATPQVLSADGAITIPAGDQRVFVTKGSAAAITIVAPTAGAPGTGDDGKIITIVSETAFAHVITCASDGFNAKGSSGTLTASAAANNWVQLIARNGHWRIIGNLNFTNA